ncbi:MAG: DUF1826 domain-containing protein [Pseudomonadota bacterium]
MLATSLQKADVKAPMQTVGSLSALDAILDEAVDGVLLKRQMPSTVRASLNALPLDNERSVRFFAAPEQVIGFLEALFAEWGMGGGAALSWIAEDAQTLAAQFAHTLSVARVHVRVDVVKGDACRKFHRDAMRARLICTYRGPGTEYGIADECCDPRHVEVTPTGCPILLKGKGWTEARVPALVHRSPPIEGTGMSRLVVVIDEG